MGNAWKSPFPSTKETGGLWASRYMDGPIHGASGYHISICLQLSSIVRYRNQATFVSNGLTFAEAYERTGRTDVTDDRVVGWMVHWLGEVDGALGCPIKRRLDSEMVFTLPESNSKFAPEN